MLLLQSSFVRWLPTFCLLVNAVRCMTPNYKDETDRRQQQRQLMTNNSPYQTTAISPSQINTAHQASSAEGREVVYESKPEAEHREVIISDRSGGFRPFNLADDSLLTRPVKRIVGLFRCSGWGPSCSGGGGGGGQSSSGGYSASSANALNSPAADKLLMQNQSSRRRKHQRSYDHVQKLTYHQHQPQQQQQQPQLASVSAVNSQGRSSSSRRQAMKFEPFFTLTSGGSWGPAGRRRRR